MLTRQEYLQNPCRASALPYWKLCAGNLTEGVEVIHEKEAGKRIGDVSTAVECYFRLFHHLDTLSIDSHSEIVLQTAWKEVNVFAEIINASYPDLRVSEAQLLQLQAQACFSPEGWVVALDRQSGKPLACGIAALDRQMQEISLEWIQVLPGKRGRGIGRSLVIQLLSNMKDRARFATVSGRADGPCSPELFYRKCGFTGDDIWIVRRETLQAKQKAGSSGRESKK